MERRGGFSAAAAPSFFAHTVQGQGEKEKEKELVPPSPSADRRLFIRREQKKFPRFFTAPDPHTGSGKGKSIVLRFWGGKRKACKLEGMKSEWERQR